jgi:hypothetical protein
MMMTQSYLPSLIQHTVISLYPRFCATCMYMQFILKYTPSTVCYLHAPCTILQGTLTTQSPRRPASPDRPSSGLIFSGSRVLTVPCCASMSPIYVGKHIPESYYCFRPLPWPALFHLSRLPARPPAHTKPLLTQGTRDLYHTFHALSPAPLGSDDGRGIEDATLPLVQTLSREDESGTQPDSIHASPFNPA